MSFLIDPPLLAATGVAIERYVDDRRVGDLLEAGVVATFVGVSTGLYVNAPATRWLWELCRAESGRDWMLNSGVFDIEHDDPPVATHLVSGAIFATYPLWIRMGRLGVRSGDRAPQRSRTD